MDESHELDTSSHAEEGGSVHRRSSIGNQSPGGELFELKNRDLGPRSAKVVAAYIERNFPQPNITGISLARDNLCDAGVWTISEVLRNYSLYGFRHIDLRSNSISPDGMACVGDALASDRQHSLTSLDLSSISSNNKNFMSLRGAEALARVIKANTSLRTLRLANVGQAGFTELIKRGFEPTCHVVRLDVSGNWLKTAAFTRLCRALQNSEVTHLNLSRNPFGVDSCEALFELMASSETLEYLNISNCELTPWGAFSNPHFFKHLGKAIGMTKTLNCLILDDNNLGDLGLRQVAEGLKRKEKQQEYMEEAEFRRLETLSLINCQISDPAPLTDILPYNKSLTSLNMSGNFMANRAAFQFGEMLSKPWFNTAEEIERAWKFGVGDTETLRIPPLRSLTLSRCGIDSVGGAAFLGVLGARNRLKRLVLTENDISADVAKKFIERIELFILDFEKRIKENDFDPPENAEDLDPPESSPASEASSSSSKRTSATSSSSGLEKKSSTEQHQTKPRTVYLKLLTLDLRDNRANAVLAGRIFSLLKQNNLVSENHRLMGERLFILDWLVRHPKLSVVQKQAAEAAELLEELEDELSSAQELAKPEMQRAEDETGRVRDQLIKLHNEEEERKRQNEHFQTTERFIQKMESEVAKADLKIVAEVERKRLKSVELERIKNTCLEVDGEEITVLRQEIESLMNEKKEDLPGLLENGKVIMDLILKMQGGQDSGASSSGPDLEAADSGDTSSTRAAPRSKKSKGSSMGSRPSSTSSSRRSSGSSTGAGKSSQRRSSGYQ